MDPKRLMDTAVLAGEIMLRSGAETYRVEDTMEHILKNAGADHIETIALVTGLMATVYGDDLKPITIVKRVTDRSTNLNKIVQVNDISRRFCSGELTLDETYEALGNIKGKQYNTFVYNIATVGVAVGFAMFFGGSPIDVLATTAAGILLAVLTTLGKKLGVNVFILDMISSAGIAVAAVIMKMILPGENMDIVIISAIMPLVPGVAITNAIRDTLQGDYISGGARALEAFLKAAALALGVGIGMAVFQNMFVQGGTLWL